MKSPTGIVSILVLLLLLSGEPGASRRTETVQPSAEDVQQPSVPSCDEESPDTDPAHEVDDSGAEGAPLSPDAGSEAASDRESSTLFPSPCILFFTQSNCPPCRTVEATIIPWVERSGWTVVPIDVNRNPLAMREFSVSATPTLIVIRNHEECGRSVGSGFDTFAKVLKRACEDPVKPVGNLGICCCQGTHKERCMCLKEIAAGIRRGPCSCSTTAGTRHYLDSRGNPIGPVPDEPGKPHLVRLNNDILNPRRPVFRSR